MSLKTDKKYLIKYTIIFILLTLIIFNQYIFGDKVYIFTDIGSDTNVSFWPVYKYLIESIKNGDLSLWSFNIGIGGSIFSLGIFLFDPFNLILILSPIKYLPYGLLIANILKMYLMGIGLFYLLKKFNVKEKIAILGAIIWSFNGFIMLWGQHYMFATTIMLFTYVVLGIEVFLRENKKVIFIVSMTLLLMNSAYMGYTVTIFIFVYGLLRYLFENKFKIKEFVRYYIRLISLYLTAIGCSAIIFLPMCYQLLTSPRVKDADSIIPSLIADKYTLASSFARLFSNNIMGINEYIGNLNYYESIILSTSVVVLLLIPQIFSFIKNKRKRYIIFISMIIGIISVSSPMVAYVFNGFTTIAYRWSFVIMLPMVLCAFISLNYIYEKKILSKLNLIISTIVVLLIFILSIFFIVNNSGIISNEIKMLEIAIQVIIIIVFIITNYIVLMFYVKRRSNVFIAMLSIVVLSELIFLNYPTVNNRTNITKDYLTNNHGYYDGTIEAVDLMEDKSFYRVAKEYKSVYINDQYFQGYYGLESYLSLNTAGYIEFCEQYDNFIAGYVNWISDIRGDKNIRSILGVKYILDKYNKIDNEYSYYNKLNEIDVYKNDSTFPLGVTYDNYILKDEFFKEIPLADKSQVMLNTVVLKNDVNYIDRYKYLKENIQGDEIPYIITYNNLKNLEVKDNNISYVYINENSSIDFEINSVCDEPIVLGFDIDIESPMIGHLYYTKENGEEEEYSFVINHVMKTYGLPIDYNKVKNIRLSLGHGNQEVKINNIKIYKKKDILSSALNNKDLFNITEFKEDKITGTISNERDKVLVFSIPYDNGWKITVDNKKVETFNANGGLLGIKLEAGNHNIVLNYMPKGLIIGMCISIITYVILTIFYITGNTKKNVRKSRNN